MSWIIQQTSTYGTRHPVVARLAVQTLELIKWSNLPDEKQKEVLHLYVNTLKPHLLTCHEILDRLQTSLKESVEKLAPQSDPRVRSIPYVPNLEVEAASFLYEVKNYLRDLLGLLRIFFGCNLKDASALYNAQGSGDSPVVAWASEQFGDKDKLTELLRSEQEWVEEWIRMRNAVEHPGEKSGTLIIHNVRPHPKELIAPAWSRDNRPEGDIFTDMQTGLHNMLTVAEELLIACIEKTTPHKIVTFYEIPEEKRNPDCPERFRIGLLPEFKAAAGRKEAETDG